jgi:hypothetical protein
MPEILREGRPRPVGPDRPALCACWPRQRLFTCWLPARHQLKVYSDSLERTDLSFLLGGATAKAKQVREF